MPEVVTGRSPEVDFSTPPGTRVRYSFSRGSYCTDVLGQTGTLREGPHPNNLYWVVFDVDRGRENPYGPICFYPPELELLENSACQGVLDARQRKEQEEYAGT